jgi:hypothetical protein
MFNETAYGNLGDVQSDCTALKLDCDTRFPVDPNNPLPTGPDPNWDCLKANGFVAKCVKSTGYMNPGSTTYGIDILTNPNNPDTIWQWPQFMTDLAAPLGLSPSQLALIGGGLLLALVGGSLLRR